MKLIDHTTPGRIRRRISTARRNNYARIERRHRAAIGEFQIFSLEVDQAGPETPPRRLQ